MEGLSRIKLRLDVPSFSLELWVTVIEVGPERVVLAVVGDNIGKLVFNPSGARFRYQDPREAEESIKSDVEAKVVCTLSILLPDGVNFLLYERWKEGEAG